MNKDLFEMFNTNSFVVGYGPRGIITLGDRMDEIEKAAIGESYSTIEELKSNGLAVLLSELVKEGEAKVKETLWSEDDGDVCIVEWKGKEYGVFWIHNESDWEVTTPETAKKTVNVWKELL